MSDQDKSDHWNLLASGLGATPADDDEVESAEAREPESVEPSPQAEIEEPIVEYPQSSTPLEAAPPADWSQLAGDLGVAVPEQPSDVASEQLDPPPPQTVDEDEPAFPSEEAFAQPALLADADEQDEVDEEQENELAELALDARDGGGFASGVFSDPLDVESDAEEPSLIDDTAEVDALEGDVATVDTDEPPAEKKPGRRRRRRRRRKPSADGPDTASESAADDQSDDAIVVVDGPDADTLETSLVADETESALSDSEEPPAKTKRRRRRRRGSGRKTKPTSEDDQPAENDAPESDEEPKVVSDDEPKRRGRRRTSRDVESEEDQEGSEKAAKTSHRAIPSWSDAIDGVIAANLENHKKNASGGSSRSRGGRRRGGRDRSSNRTK